MPRIGALLDEAIARGASDLHLGAGHPPLARVRGDLVTLDDAATSAGDVDAFVGELLDGSQRARLAAEHAVVFGGSHEHGERTARFRGQIVHAQGGARVSLRMFPVRVRSLADLGCPDDIARLAEVRGGLVVVAGPHGSGKTSTLAAMIDHVGGRRACHVVTVEDPIEMVHDPKLAQIAQREVGVHVPSFEAALEDVVREGADVVLVSTVRTRAVLRGAIALAASGVTVLVELPARDVAGAIEHLAASADERERLAEVLAGVVAQHRAKDHVVYDVVVTSPEMRASIAGS